MQCYICSQVSWQSMDDKGIKFHRERELMVCKGCGCIAYKVEPEDEAKVLDYYRKSYRPAPNHTNLITTTRKLNYIMAPHMLGKFLEGKKGLICGDIGAAIGYLAAQLRRMGHRATGSEMTVTYRRFSEHFYGIPLTEELETKHRYDFLSMYHVLEHLIVPDKKLEKYVPLLKEDGRFFIATPEWLDVLDQWSGDGIQGVEHHFHKDHINVFTRQAILNLFHKSGLLVESEDHITYGQTYLLRKAGPTEQVPGMVVEDWRGQVDKLKRAREALVNFQRKDFEKARELFPKFPEAWINSIMGIHGKDPIKQKDLWDELLALCPANFRVRQVFAIWCYQHRHYQAALDNLNWVMTYRPNEDAMFRIGDTLQAMGRLKESIPYYQKVAELNPTMWAECMNNICHAASKLPAWDERAAEEIKATLYAKHAPEFTVAPQDPVMEAQNGNGTGHAAGGPAAQDGLGSAAEQAREPEVVAPEQARRLAGSP